MKTLAVLLLCLSLPVAAATLEGRVVGVSDGDTITVLDIQNVQHRIRLSAIDAPEKTQPFGNRSKEHLSKWVYNRSVLVEWNKRDRYGRIVGQVLIDGHDAGLEQVRAGMAKGGQVRIVLPSTPTRSYFLGAGQEQVSANR